jgi:hypothetical protein
LPNCGDAFDRHHAASLPIAYRLYLPQEWAKHAARRKKAHIQAENKPAPGHKVYPFLLRGVKIERPNQVWATDISVPQQAA